MSIDARLNRLSPALTARERAVLVLKSLRAKTPADPSWRRTMPPEQVAEFNRLIVLMNACNIYLPLYISVLNERVQQLYLRFGWLDSLISLGSATWELARLLPASTRAKAQLAVGSGYPVVELPWEAVEQPHSWLAVGENMTQALRRSLVGLWLEVRSVDIVLGEVAQEFRGEDPLRPIMRGVLEDTRKQLQDLHEVLSAVEPLDLPEPDDEEMELTRIYFQNGVRLMERV